MLLGLVCLLTVLAWSNLWNLGTGICWFQPLADEWPPLEPRQLPALPYTLPGSPGGRAVRWLGRLWAWWQEAFWPAVGTALVGLLVAAALAVLLSLFLPDRLRPLNAALIALIGLGISQRRRGQEPLAERALLQVGLSWLAGHAAFACPGLPSLSLALAFTVVAVGAWWATQGQRGALGLLNGALGAVMVLLVALRQPLAAGAVGLFLLGQAALQPPLRAGDKVMCAGFSRRAWPWLIAAMLTSAVAVA